jgi:hypothetical protein
MQFRQYQFIIQSYSVLLQISACRTLKPEDAGCIVLQSVGYRLTCPHSITTQTNSGVFTTIRTSNPHGIVFSEVADSYSDQKIPVMIPSDFVITCSLPVDCILSQFNAFHVFTHHFSKFHFNIILQYMPRSPKQSLPFRFSYTFICISFPWMLHVTPTSFFLI